MICVIKLDAQDLRGMAVAIAMPNRRSRVTRDIGPVEDEAAGMLSDSISTMIRPERQF
jgi:hypothetical protein